MQGVLSAEMGKAGARSGAYVVDLATGRTLFARAADKPRIPASVEKLYTLAAALAQFGPEGRLTTSVLGVGQADASGVWRGDLYLRGAGDPSLDVAALARLATAVGRSVTRVAGSIVGDPSVLDNRPGAAAGGYGPSSELTGTLSGLAVDRGRSGNHGTPAAYAAGKLAAELRAGGVAVTGRSADGSTPPGAAVLASVDSPPMSTLARLTALRSDNFFAEMLLKDLGARFAHVGSTLAGAQVVRRWLASLGLRPRVIDGSGLSRSNRTSPRQVVDLLKVLTGQLAPVGVALRDALPVAGRSGTLRRRMRRGPAAGNCQAKTGTLAGVSALAGWCGTRTAFAFLMEGVDNGRAHALQDRMTQAVAALG